MSLGRAAGANEHRRVLAGLGCLRAGSDIIMIAVHDSVTARGRVNSLVGFRVRAFPFFDSVVAKAGFGGEQRQLRFDGVMAWWPAAMLSARAGTGRREHLSPHPAAGGARGESTTKFTTVFTTRFHAQAQQKQKSTTKSTTVFTQVFTTVFTQVFSTLWWRDSTPRLSNIRPSIHHRIHSSMH